MWLLAFAALALADWAAVARECRGLEAVAKPGALLALLAYAWTGEGPSPWLLAAVAFSLAGDVFLLPTVDLFPAGLGSFLLAHLCYLLALPAALPARLGFTAAAAAALAPVALRILRSVPEGLLRVAAAGYALALAAVLGSAVASGRSAAAAGAALFVASDGVLGWARFVQPKRWAPLVIIATYHCGQLGLVAALRNG